LKLSRHPFSIMHVRSLKAFTIREGAEKHSRQSVVVSLDRAERIVALSRSRTDSDGRQGGVDHIEKSIVISTDREDHSRWSIGAKPERAERIVDGADSRL
jgi:hypothetical protein